jgi:hypothetical protein
MNQQKQRQSQKVGLKTQLITLIGQSNKSKAHGMDEGREYPLPSQPHKSSNLFLPIQLQNISQL